MHEKELKAFAELAYALAVARQKHPVYARNAEDAWDVIEDELIELHSAVYNESEERQHEEAIDVAVTALRFILKEHIKDVDKMGESG